LQEKLKESEKRVSLFEIQVEELQSKNKEVVDQLDKKITVEVELAKARSQLADAQEFEIALTELKEQHTSLIELFESLKEENQELARSLEEASHSKHELKGKLHETLVSVEENIQAYNDLRADHDALQLECQILRGDSSSLHDLVSKLTAEKEQLMNYNEKQVEEYQTLNTVKVSLEDEIEKCKSHQLSLEQLLSMVRDENQNLSSELDGNKEKILSLKQEMGGMAADISEKQQQIEALQEQSKSANRHLDEMVTYCDKLKTEFAETSSNLRKELDDQAESMKDVINALKDQLLSSESEKEENRKMYEKDIETQQAVSTRMCVFVGRDCII
jgi:chromosome segregation ATPase